MSFAETVSSFRSDLLRFARLQLRDDAAAEDAVQAVLAWTFVPAKMGYKPVEGSVEVPIRFRLTE